jgi:hypothetical protein
LSNIDKVSSRSAEIQVPMPKQNEVIAMLQPNVNPQPVTNTHQVTTTQPVVATILQPVANLPPVANTQPVVPTQTVVNLQPTVNLEPGLQCPVCNKFFRSFTEIELTRHIDECLSADMISKEQAVVAGMASESLGGECNDEFTEAQLRLSSDRVRFVSQQLDSVPSTTPECTICFEPFQKGRCQ